MLTHRCAPGPEGAELGEAMRFRGKSIRRKIVALLLVPLLSLTGIWAFATVITGREANQLFDVSDVVEKIGYPTEDTVGVLQQERRQTLVYLADPRASDALTALRRSRTATDRAVAKVRANAKGGGMAGKMGSGTAGRLTVMLDALDGIDSLRRSVEEGTVDRAQALDLYNRLVDPCYTLVSNLHLVDNVDMDKQGRALVTMDMARELLSREDALLGSALVAGRVTGDESRDISDLVAQRTLLYDVSLPLLPDAESERFESYWKNAETAPCAWPNRPSSPPRPVHRTASPRRAGTGPPGRCSTNSATSTTRRATGTTTGSGRWPPESSSRRPSRASSDSSPCSSRSSCPSASAGASSATWADCAWRRTRPPASGCPA